jgi:hypothetical protein
MAESQKGLGLTGRMPVPRWISNLATAGNIAVVPYWTVS